MQANFDKDIVHSIMNVMSVVQQTNYIDTSQKIACAVSILAHSLDFRKVGMRSAMLLVDEIVIVPEKIWIQIQLMYLLR